MYKVLIAENIPAMNKGELALLKGIITSLDSLNTEITIISRCRDNDAKRYSDELTILDVKQTFHLEFNEKSYIKKIAISVFISLKHIFFLILYKIMDKRVLKLMKADIWKEYLNSDIIIVGHNGTFGIGNGLLGNVFNPLTFLSYIYLPFFGVTIKKPLIIYGSSIPPYSNQFIRKWMCFLLNRINLITLREPKSMQNLMNIGYSANKAFLTGDLAFLMEPASENITNKLMIEENLSDETMLIGITVTRYKAVTAFKDLGQNESYKKHSRMIANVIDQLIETKNAQVIFLPHSIGYEKIYDDRILSEYIYTQCKNKNEIRLIKKEYSPEELKGLMKNFDLFIGERLHSVIGAMSMNTPSIVLSNHTDQRLEIIKQIGMEDSICYVEGLEDTELLMKIEDILKNKEKIKQELKIQIEAIKMESMKNGRYVTDLLNGLLL